MTVIEALKKVAAEHKTVPGIYEMDPAEAILYLASLWGSVKKLATDLLSQNNVLKQERDAARANHLKTMKERDAAFSLLDSFRNAHVSEHRWGQVCTLCIAAEKMTAP